MIGRILNVGQAVLLGAVLGTACKSRPAEFDDSETKDVLAAVQSRHGCPKSAQRVAVSGADSLPRGQQCALVAAALNAMGSADSLSGLQRSDSSAVESALLMPMSIDDSTCASMRSYWSVGLSLRGKPYDAEVQVDRITGVITARRIHKPIR